MDKKQIFSRKFLFLENRSNREILSEILSRKRFYLRINKFFEEIYLEIIEKGSREDIIDLRIRVEKLKCEILIKRNFSVESLLFCSTIYRKRNRCSCTV